MLADSLRFQKPTNAKSETVRLGASHFGGRVMIIFKINNMKSKKKELDVDVIGGQGSLTPAEEKAISEFIKQRKLSSHKNKKTHRSKAA